MVITSTLPWAKSCAMAITTSAWIAHEVRYLSSPGIGVLMRYKELTRINGTFRCECIARRHRGDSPDPIQSNT